MASITRDRSKAPAVTVTQEGGYYTATVDVVGLEPTRTITAVEQAEGVTSLAPVTVRTRSASALVALAVKTTLASAWATAADLTPGECASITIRVASELRRALKQLGVET